MFLHPAFFSYIPPTHVWETASIDKSNFLYVTCRKAELKKFYSVVIEMLPCGQPHVLCEYIYRFLRSFHTGGADFSFVAIMLPIYNTLNDDNDNNDHDHVHEYNYVLSLYQT